MPIKTKAEKQAETAAKVAEKKEVAAPAPAPVEKAPKVPGKIAQIIEHHKAGKTNKEIAELHLDGDPSKDKFHATTISIQVSKYKKLQGGYDPEAAKKEREEKKALQAAEKAKVLAEKKAAKELEKANAKAKKEAEVKATREAGANLPVDAK